MAKALFLSFFVIAAVIFATELINPLPRDIYLYAHFYGAIVCSYYIFQFSKSHKVNYLKAWLVSFFLITPFLSLLVLYLNRNN